MEKCVCEYHCCHKDKYYKTERKKDVNESGYTFFYDRKSCRFCSKWLGDELCR